VFSYWVKVEVGGCYLGQRQQKCGERLLGLELELVLESGGSRRRCCLLCGAWLLCLQYPTLRWPG
jgi:hypothetical protein